VPAAESPVSPLTVTPPQTFRDRRLLILYFDYSSMDQGQQARAIDAALQFLRTKMTVSDTVAIYAYSSSLRMVQDFTEDRNRLIRAVQQLKTSRSDLSYRDRFTGDGDDQFQLFNAENKLSAMEELVKALGRYPEKKAIIYLSNGGKGTGVENLSQVRATTIAANRANVSLYALDVRGLDATPGLGGAGADSVKGADVFSGQAANKLNLNASAQQDTMSALATDTGGRMLYQTNDLTLGMQKAQEDLASYYLVGYYSSNSEPDGKFRAVKVQMKTLQTVQLEYRPGYYAPKLFKLLDTREKAQQLEEAIHLENPITDLPMVVGADYFRIDRHKYFVSLSARMSGTVIPPDRAGQETEVDFLGVLQNQAGKEMGRISDKIRIKLTPEIAAELSKRGLQYDTGFTMEPGKYTLKFLVRENQQGRIGTFQTSLIVPDPAETPGLHLSSVVWSAQRAKLDAALGSAGDSRKRQEANPLIRGDLKLIPSLTDIFNTRQSLIVYCEAYDLGPRPAVSASVGLYQGDKRVYQSPSRRIANSAAGRAETVPIEIEFPLESIAPGEYTAQLNIIDEAGHQAVFVRKQVMLVAREPN
jgi:VWFA-related protein